MDEQPRGRLTRGRAPKVTREIHELILRLRAEGWSYEQIERMLPIKLSEQTIWNWAQKELAPLSEQGGAV